MEELFEVIFEWFIHWMIVSVVFLSIFGPLYQKKERELKNARILFKLKHPEMSDEIESLF